MESNVIPKGIDGQVFSTIRTIDSRLYLMRFHMMGKAEAIPKALGAVRAVGDTRDRLGVGHYRLAMAQRPSGSASIDIGK